MDLYKLVPTFSRTTGRKIEPVLQVCGWLCDFCGRVWRDEDEYSEDHVQYRVIESGEAEPQFHELRVEGYPDVSIYDVMNEHPQFRYCLDWDRRDFCEPKMIAAAARGKFGSSPLLCTMQYEARLKMLKQVLDRRVVTLAQLKLADPDELEESGQDWAGIAKLEAGNCGIEMMLVTAAVTVGEFVKAGGYQYAAGLGFYQLTEAEQVSADKQIFLRDRQSGQLVGGEAARQFLKIPAGESVRLQPTDDPRFDIFIQTKAPRRHLKPDTIFLYRIAGLRS